MDREDVLYIHNEIMTYHEKEEILPFVTIHTDFEGIMLSEKVRWTKATTNDIIYMWNLKQNQT